MGNSRPGIGDLMDKTWEFQNAINLGTPGASSEARTYAILGIKNALIDAGMTGKWTIYGCCGKAGTGALIAPASLPDTTDRWSTIADMTAGTTVSTPQAWCILYNATLGVYLLFSMVASATATMVATKTAPTLQATATYQPAVTEACGFNADVSFFAAATNRQYLHVKMTTEGHFVACITSSALPSYYAWLGGLIPIVPSRSADQAPWMLYRYSAGSTSNVAASISGDTAYSRGFVPLITPNTETYMVGLELKFGATNSSPMELFTTDAADAKVNMLPIFIYGYSSGKLTLKGRLADIYWAPISLGYGSTTPSSGTVEFVKLGPAFFPANTALVL